MVGREGRVLNGVLFSIIILIFAFVYLPLGDVTGIYHLCVTVSSGLTGGYRAHRLLL